MANELTCRELKDGLLGLRLDTTRVTQGNFDAVFLTEHDVSQIHALYMKAGYVQLSPAKLKILQTCSGHHL